MRIFGPPFRSIVGDKKSTGRACAALPFSTISNDFMGSPTLNPLALAQAKHCFSILASAPEKPPKSEAFGSILGGLLA